MNEDQARQNNLIDTTDCLEAVGVFRGWKNFLFAIMILCLLLLQASFWLVNLGYVKTAEPAESQTAVVTEQAQEPAEGPKQVVKKTDEIKKAAKQAAAEPNQPAEAAPQKAVPLFDIKIEHLSWLIRFLDFVLILTAALYCLTMLFGLKVSMVGRLGGINHICRAFYLSLLFLVLLLPWQKFFAGVVAGAIYTPAELLKSCAAADKGTFGTVWFYLRFTGYWVVVLLLLIFSQLRSFRWAKTILRRLEVI